MKWFSWFIFSMLSIYLALPPLDMWNVAGAASRIQMWFPGADGTFLGSSQWALVIPATMMGITYVWTYSMFKSYKRSISQNRGRV